MSTDTIHATIALDAEAGTATITTDHGTRTERIDWDRTLTQAQIDHGADGDAWGGDVVQIGLADGTTWWDHGGDDWRSVPR